LLKNKEKKGNMPDKELYSFLCEETPFKDLGNEKLLHGCPAFGKCIGQALDSGNALDFSKELSARLGEMDLYKASLLSNFIGFICEKEEDTSAGQGVIKLFAKACNNVYEMFKSTEIEEECQMPEDFQAVYEKNKDWVKAYFGFNILCISTMAFLTRDTGLRKILKDMDIGEKINYLAEETPESQYLYSVYYVSCMEKTCSNLDLLVLQPGRKQGFIAKANDLNNCFHLIFLLEEQIAEKFGKKYGMSGFNADKALKQLAHGEYPENCQGKSYVTYFIECNYTTAMDTKLEQDNLYSMVWGEMPPEGIPVIDGYAVIVLFEGGINRSFDAGFLSVPHTALRPYVSIERELSDAEYNMWLGKIKETLDA